MYRKIENNIIGFIEATLKRENASESKCLLIDGLRQIGKSYSLRKVCGFPPEEMENAIGKRDFPLLGEVTCLYLALDNNEELAKAIDGGISARDLLKQISLISDFRGYDLDPRSDNRIVLIIDEIQTAEKGVNLLKYLSSIKGLTVIASGSMIGIYKNTKASFPIGYVDTIRMFPMDFEEFMMAHGYDEKSVKTLIDFAKRGISIPESTHRELSFLFKNYVMIGGLPWFVRKYQSLNFDKKSLYLDARKRMEEYKGDIAKYSDLDTRERGREVFDAVGKSLGRSSPRFYYADIKQGAKGREYRNPLSWLIDAGLVYRLKNLKSPELPLGFYEDPEEFRLYYADNLLVYSKMSESLFDLVMDDAPSIAKGPVYENACAEILYPLFGESLFYYSRKSGLEIDFVVEIGSKVCFIEVKSSENNKSKSLQTVLKNYPDSIGVRCSYRNNGRKDNLYSLPLYMLPFIDKIIGD